MSNDSLLLQDAVHDCPLCLLAQDEKNKQKHNFIWYAFGARLNLNDAVITAEKNSINVDRAQIWEHLWEHQYEQPIAEGKMHPEKAVQEAIATFPDYYFWILRTLYRTGGLSQKQMLRIFYEPYYSREEAFKRFEQDFKRLIFRSYIFRYYPEMESVLFDEQKDAYFFLNRQAIPVVENLEKVKIPFKSYTTSNKQVEEFNLEEDAHLWECFTTIRTSLYGQEFEIKNTKVVPYVSAENLYTSQQLNWLLPATPKSQPVKFIPMMFSALRLEGAENVSSLHPFFVEYDRGSKEVVHVVQKIINYLRFYSSPVYKKAFPDLASVENYLPPIFVISDTPSRVGSIINMLEGKISNLIPVYFCDYETFRANPWASGVWRTINARDNERFTMLPRLLFHSQLLTKSRVYGARDRIIVNIEIDKETSKAKDVPRKPTPPPVEKQKVKEEKVYNVDEEMNLDDLL